jgi:hypothetical protein
LQRGSKETRHADRGCRVVLPACLSGAFGAPFLLGAECKAGYAPVCLDIATGVYLRAPSLISRAAAIARVFFAALLA